MRQIEVNLPGIEVLPLAASHLDRILALMNAEGWYYYDRHELKRYLNLNQDCFVLCNNKKVIGSLFTTNFGNQAWIGNIIVSEAERGKGLASELIRGVIDYLGETKQIRTFRLGSVPLAIGLYKKAGFRAEAFTTAQEADLPLKADLHKVDPGDDARIDRMTVEDLAAVARMDETYFKSNRLGLLTELYHDSIKDGCLCLKARGRLAGFLMVRRRKASKTDGGFAHGPDSAFRLGPCCVLPKYGISGFKALFQAAIPAVNQEAGMLGGSAKIYAVFPRAADKTEIYEDTRALAKAMGMGGGMDLDGIFDEHDQLFRTPKSDKNKAQSEYMKTLGFQQEYFEQVMRRTPGGRKAEETRADPEGIFATATPGDKS